jgi:hypothetical protein
MAMETTAVPLTLIKDKVKLEFYAKTLGLNKSSGQWKTFFDLASVSNKSVLDKIESPLLLQKLPIFLRTIDNKKPTEEHLNRLLELIRRS